IRDDLVTGVQTCALPISQGRGGRGGDPNWPPPGPTPRTADGHPDLTGNWQPNAIGQNVDMIRAGVDVPMLPEAKAIYDKRKAAQIGRASCRESVEVRAVA